MYNERINIDVTDDSKQHKITNETFDGTIHYYFTTIKYNKQVKINDHTTNQPTNHLNE